MRYFCIHIVAIQALSAHKKTSTGAGMGHALGHQPVIGLHHGVAADPGAVGQLAHRRQAGASAQAVARQQLQAVLHQLLDQGRHARRALGLPAQGIAGSGMDCGGGLIHTVGQLIR